MQDSVVFVARQSQFLWRRNSAVKATIQRLRVRIAEFNFVGFTCHNRQKGPIEKVW